MTLTYYLLATGLAALVLGNRRRASHDLDDHEADCAGVVLVAL